MLELRNVRCRAQDGRMVLDDINMTVGRGEYVAVLGESGSGKSVLAQVLSGARTPTGGEYFFDGYRVPSADAARAMRFLRGRVQVISASTAFLNGLSAAENVRLALAAAGMSDTARRDTAERLLELCGLADAAQSRPNLLSRGQRYRLALARAAAGGCGTLICDEPTENADQNYARELLAGFSYLQRREKTVIIMTANIEIALNAQRVINLSGGRII